MSACPLVQAVGMRPGTMAAAVGGGGKTSILEALARGCHAAGWRPAVLTTTTKIFAPGEDVGLLLGEAGALGEALAGKAAAAAGHLVLARARLGEAPVPGAPDRRRMKLEGFPPGEVSRFRTEEGVLLVEADGARGLPVKAPGPGEPAVPAGAEIVLGVVGLDSIGKPLDAANACRPGRLAELAGQPAGSPIGPGTIARLALHPEGIFRGSPGGARRILILNKADGLKTVEESENFAYSIMNVAGAPKGPVDAVLCTSCLLPAPRVLFRLPG